MRILNENMPCSENDDEERSIDFDSWLENICLDLQSVFTPGELNLFKKVLSVSPQGNGISTTSAICLKCGEATGKLNAAYGRLAAAWSSYDYYGPSYCDFGIGPDSVKIYLWYAYLYAFAAKEAAYDAHLTCNCDSAGQAWTNALQARWNLSQAIRNTAYDCGGPAAPWFDNLSTAYSYLQNGINKLQYGCNKEACN